MIKIRIERSTALISADAISAFTTSFPQVDLLEFTQDDADTDDYPGGDGEEGEGEDKPEPETTESFEREAEDAFETVWRLTFSDGSEALYLRVWRGTEFIGTRNRFAVDDPDIVAKQLVGILADGNS